MKNIINRNWIAIFVLFAFVLVSGCGDNDKNKKESSAPAVGTNQIQPAVSGSPLPTMSRLLRVIKSHQVI